MNLGWNIETIASISGVMLSSLGCIYILRFSFKQYGLLFLLTAVTGEALCYLFVATGLYSYPFRIFPQISQMPITLVMTMFPFYVLFGVRYSPSKWAYKIPFYWVLVHIGMLGEVLAQNFTRIIKYQKFWDTWDSYTWWWLFLLFFELVGGSIVKQENRKPMDETLFQYGKIGWYILHLILISTIFLGGIYLGIKIVM